MNGYNKCFESTNQGLGAVFEQKDRSNWAVSGSITSVKWITLENVLFPDWRWLLPIARRARCSSGDDAVRFSINFYYVSTADAEQSRGTFVIWFFLQPPFSFTLSSSHNTPFLLLSLSIRLSSVVSFVRFVCFFTFFFPFSAFFFSFLFPFAILIHVSFRWAFRGWTTGRGNEMDNRTAVRSQGRICLPFSSRAVWEKGKVRIRRFTDLFSSPQQFGILADSFVLIHLFSPLKASLYIITNTAYTNGSYIYRI